MINSIQKKILFNANEKAANKGVSFKLTAGIDQPPKKASAANVDIKIMLQYSAKKNMAKIIAEYSTLYPATNSASASGKSKGALFVSAKDEIKKIIKIGKSGQMNQTVFT